MTSLDPATTDDDALKDYVADELEPSASGRSASRQRSWMTTS